MEPYSPYSDSSIIVSLVMYLVLIGIGLIAYIFRGVGLYAIAKNRGYRKPWLAWIPIANEYLLGAIADNINQYKGKKSSYRKIILGIYIAIIASVILFVYFFFIMVLMRCVGDGSVLDIWQDISILVAILFLYYAYIALIVTAYVFSYIASYQVFCDYNQNNAVLFLILSIFLRLLGLQSIFLFVIRKKTSATLYYAQQQYQYQQYILQQQMQGNQAYSNPQQPQNPQNMNNQ